jgi:hypothetical protein
VSQSKFTVLNVRVKKIFGEFIEFFIKGLNPFKIQTKFKLDLFLGFYFKIHLNFELLSIRKVVPFEFIYPLAKYGKFLKSRSTNFII